MQMNVKLFFQLDQISHSVTERALMKMFYVSIQLFIMQLMTKILK